MYNSHFIGKFHRAVPIQGEFDTISLTQIGTRFKGNIPATIAWCTQHGLLAASHRGTSFVAASYSPNTHCSATICTYIFF